jgi:hypothetical protein
MDFGVRQDGTKVNDIQLPAWANGDVSQFLSKHRQALDGDIVSANLHKWIDLIFGIKQASLEDNNLFHPYSYEGSKDVSQKLDPE